MRKPNRYAARFAIERRRTPAIPEDAAFGRVLSAIRTIEAMPDRERRFLTSGQGLWLAKLGSKLTWHDLNSHEDKNLEPLHRVHVDIPADIAEFFGLPGDRVDRMPDTPPTPMRVGDVCQARVDFRNERMAARAKRRGINPVKFVPAVGYIPEKEPEESRESFRPTRAQVSDAIVAGEWFAKLALMPENIDEFERRLDQYANGGRRSPQVDDQRILSFYAFGWSLKLIGERYGLNEFQTERRIAEIRTSVHRIANGWARLADIENRGISRKAEQATRGSRAQAGG